MGKNQHTIIKTVTLLINKIKILIEIFFLKERYVLVYNLKSYSYKKINNPLYKIIKINKDDLIIEDKVINKKYFDFLSKKIGYIKLINRLSNNICNLFLGIKINTLEPIGFYWVMIPKENSIRFDKFCIKPGYALAFHAYVSGSHRRKGVYTLLITAIRNYLYKYDLCQHVYTIIEKNNFASMKANIKSGSKVIQKNYLIKFFKRNIFSIYFGNNEKKIYFVFKNFKDF